jgi:serpin B
VPAVAAGNNAFSFDFFRAVRSKSHNLVVSPYGLFSVLSMAMAGAKGETRQEMSDVLRLDLPEGQLYPALGALASSLVNIPDLTSASALWGQTGRSYERPFVNLLGKTYGAPINLLDFGDYKTAARAINEWVNQKTHGRVPELVDPEGPQPDQVIMMLTNAVYMKATWQSPFSKEATTDRPFHLLDGGTVPVPTMSKVDTFSYLSTSDLDAVALPYEDGRLSLVLLAPELGGFEGYADEMSIASFEETLAAMQTGEVDLRFPRFSFTSSPDAKGALQVLGMTLPFSLRADFSGITKPQANLSNVVQKAFIVVDEAGTEAAAASGVTVAAGATTTSLAYPTLFIDRPFYYVIRDNETGTILFLGQVTDPR